MRAAGRWAELRGDAHGTAEVLAVLCSTLQRVWRTTRNEVTVVPRFLEQLARRLQDVYALHPEFQTSSRGIGRMQVHSIDLRSGKRRLEIDRPIRGEAEGLATLKARGGTLHWLIAPFDPKGRTPTYGGGDSALLTFARRR